MPKRGSEELYDEDEKIDDMDDDVSDQVPNLPPSNMDFPRNDGEKDVDFYRRASKAVRLSQKALSKWTKDNTIPNATKRHFQDGTSGYGRYKTYRRRPRRTMRRRSYGARRYRGRGGYLEDGWNWLKSVVPKGSSSSFGKFVGNAIGGPLVGEAGGHLGQAFANYTGLGAYAPDGSDTLTQNVPSITNTRGDDGAVVVRHKEFIGDVATLSAAFALAYSLKINPGLSNTFPWLSGIAKNFTQYKIEGLMFSYVSTSGSLSTTQALGEIIMACNYNVLDNNFINKQQMLNEVFSVSKVPSLDSVCPVECDRHQTPMDHLLVRSGPVPSGQDARFYDFASFNLATQGSPSAVTLGELWVTYQIALYKPQLNTNGVSVNTGYSMALLAGTSAAGITGVSNQRFGGFGETFSIVGSNCQVSIPWEAFPMNGNIIFTIGGHILAPAAVLYPAIATSFNMAVGPPLFYNLGVFSSSNQSPQSGTTSNTTCYQVSFQGDSDLAAPYLITWPTTWAAPTWSSVWYSLQLVTNPV